MDTITDSKAFTDTDENAEEIQLSIMRKMSPAEKLELIFSLSNAAIDLARVGIKHRQPNADEKEISHQLADLLLGKSLAKKVYGENPGNMK